MLTLLSPIVIALMVTPQGYFELYLVGFCLSLGPSGKTSGLIQRQVDVRIGIHTSGYFSVRAQMSPSRPEPNVVTLAEWFWCKLERLGSRR